MGPSFLHRLASVVALLVAGGSAAAWLPACVGEDPVLKGVPEAPLLTELPAEPAAAAAEPEEAPRRSANPRLYTKPDDIYIDLSWMVGRNFREARPVVVEQLGALQAVVELDAVRGQRLQFERGELRMVDDKVYYGRIPLPSPLRRDQALADAGFLAPIGKWLATHRAYRLNNERGFRRLRLDRADPEGEDVTAIEAWKWIPGEHSSRK